MSFNLENTSLHIVLRALYFFFCSLETAVSVSVVLTAHIYQFRNNNIFIDITRYSVCPPHLELILESKFSFLHCPQCSSQFCSYCIFLKCFLISQFSLLISFWGIFWPGYIFISTYPVLCSCFSPLDSSGLFHWSFTFF